VANYQRLVNLVVKEENSPGRQTMDAKYPLDFLVTPQAKSSLQTSRRLWQKKKNPFISMIPNYTHQHIWHEEPTDRKCCSENYLNCV